MIATTTVQHRGGYCLHIPVNQHKNVLDRIDDTCYRKTSKKRFPITITSPSYHLSYHLPVCIDDTARQHRFHLDPASPPGRRAPDKSIFLHERKLAHKPGAALRETAVLC